MVVDESLHGRLRERERRGQGQGDLELAARQQLRRPRVREGRPLEGPGDLRSSLEPLPPLATDGPSEHEKAFDAWGLSEGFLAANNASAPLLAQT